MLLFSFCIHYNSILFKSIVLVCRCEWRRLCRNTKFVIVFPVEIPLFDFEPLEEMAGRRFLFVSVGSRSPPPRFGGLVML